jgi:TDG/mug DNA glycosylase family protein
VSAVTGRARAARGPTREELQAAYGRTVPDLVGPGVRVLLVGINPSLWSAHVRQHFGRPGNRLWRTLHEAGFTTRRLAPHETDEVVAAGLGITNLVARATARADELDDDEIRAGVEPLTALVAAHRPRWVAVLGVSAYRVAFGDRRAVVGAQQRTIAGAGTWVLPNPSGLNAHYQQDALNGAYGALRAAAFGQ